MAFRFYIYMEPIAYAQDTTHLDGNPHGPSLGRPSGPSGPEAFFLTSPFFEVSFVAMLLAAASFPNSSPCSQLTCLATNW